MRPKFAAQIGIDFSPSNLKLTNQYYAKYEKISSVLDENPEMIEFAYADLKFSLRHARAKISEGGSFRYTCEQVVRILVSQVVEGESLRGIVVRIDDSNFLRRFVRIDDGPMMDFTTLCKLKNSIRPETWHRINRLLAVHCVEHDLISGERLRLDTTAVETNIHWPTDSSLLWDTYRVFARLIESARKIDQEAVGTRRLQVQRTKRLYTKISRKAGKKGGTSVALKPEYKDLISAVDAIFDWTTSVADALRQGRKSQRYGFMEDLMAQALVEQMEHTRDLATPVISQARRRVLQGESVPNDEKIFSIFEPHTELLKRGKAGKPIEFGHMIQIQQVQEKFITDYAVFEKRPVEHQLLTPAVESHKELFDKYPLEVSADKGYYESMTALEDLQQKVPMVSIGKKGKRTKEQAERERDPFFRHAQRFRAGIEGTISFLKRILQLHRCFAKGWEHFEATVGATVFAHNLLIIARC